MSDIMSENNMIGFESQIRERVGVINGPKLTGEDSEVRLDAHHQIEFDAWRWANLAEAPGLIVPFKRASYEAVAEAFKGFAQPS